MFTTMQLTKKQKTVLTFLQENDASDGGCPSYREIGKRLGIQSTNGVNRHIEALIKKGFIQKAPGKARALRILRGRSPRMISVSMLGTIPAGFPDDSGAQEQLEPVFLQIDPALIGVGQTARLFAVQAKGNSMRDAGIVDGDFAVFEDRPAMANEIVAALLDRQSTLKRLIFQGGKAFLKAENVDFPEMHPQEELTVQGVVVALLRRIGGLPRSCLDPLQLF